MGESFMSERSMHHGVLDADTAEIPIPHPSRSSAACVHHLIENQAARTPQAVAVIGGERQLTYAELERQANQLGHYLRQLGVGPEARVGICLPRSVEQI